MSQLRSFSNTCLIIKRHNYKETDRLVTLISQEKGKFTTIAKGVRKLNSSKRGLLEPGNVIKGFFINTKSMPLLTQAKLIKSTANLQGSLNKIRQLTQVLEVFDKLLVEEQLNRETFDHIINIRNLVLKTNNKAVIIRQELSALINLLGFGTLAQANAANILEYVSQISEQSMKSFDFLKVK